MEISLHSHFFSFPCLFLLFVLPRRDPADLHAASGSVGSAAAAGPGRDRISSEADRTHEKHASRQVRWRGETGVGIKCVGGE